MKRFFAIFAAVLVCAVIFLTLGGSLLLDFSRHFFAALAICAFAIALIINGFVAQSDRIDSLEKRIQLLEKENEENNNK